MVGNKPLTAPKVTKPDQVDDSSTQNQKVIKALFIGKILVWDRSKSGQKYEIRVEGVERFVDNKTGKVIEAKSLSTACIALVGDSGWDELKVCLVPEKEPRKLSYYRAKFLSAQK
ncbi:hypothetical protein HET73_06835 [Wolbachia endosymbiont of Atemnus politus]|uniref:hypothetical protein n=1 Tax=Wolbachia endosymbiont of Atemnus politus TaxID=2682840 RepID=UPI0015727105|nr:hypothetical protein [Wolbachia endosymbiont of Atemnus politus]NSM57000.1 hypothetical protein [Wolbachia endosymbiont of Atemnus politus]NSX83677.1 hypothetical protein [Wolbachia endosymbiont of Atemnus politus]